MSQPRKRSRSLEHQEAAEQEAYDAGVEYGITLGREAMAFELGQKLGFDKGRCLGYDAGYTDAQAGKPRAHQPHTIPDDLNELIHGETHD